MYLTGGILTLVKLVQGLTRRARRFIARERAIRNQPQPPR